MSKNTKIFMYIICFCLFASVIYITYSSYAKYKSESDIFGEPIAASWDVSINSNTNSLSAIAGNGTVSYTLNVYNNSEVEVGYNIVISNIPNDIQVKLDNGNYVTPVSNTVTFSNVGTLDYDQNTSNSHIITFQTTLSTNVITNNSIDFSVNFSQL